MNWIKTNYLNLIDRAARPAQSVPRLALLLAALLLTAESGFAAPSGYNADETNLREVKKSSKSTLISDHQDSNLVWVLPPDAGKAEFTGFQPTANLGFCPGLKSLHKSSNSLSSDMEDVATEIANSKVALDKAKTAVVTAKNALAELIAKNSYLQDLNAKAASIAEADLRMSALHQQINTCTQGCEDLVTELNHLNQENRTRRQEYAQLQSKNIAESRLLDSARRNVEQKDEIYDFEHKSVLDKVNLRAEIQDAIFRMYSNHARLQGGTAHADYQLGWTDVVKDLAEKHSDFNFQKVPSYDVKINFNPIASTDTNAAALQSASLAVMAYSIAGLPMPTVEQPNILRALPDVIAADIHLSLVGACPMGVKDFYQDMPDMPNPKVYSASIEYMYPRVFKMSITAKYNLFKIYERIMKNTKKGGFFSSTARNSVVEYREDQDSFFVDWKGGDPRAEIKFEDRLKIENTLKEDLVNRVLQSLATPIYNGEPAEVLATGESPVHGAVVLADTMAKECGLSMYCKVSGWVIRGFDSIFGRSSSESSFKTEWNRTATESRTSETVTLVPGTVGFSSKI